MKIKSLLVGMLACTALVGCSNEEILNEQEAGKGQQSYLSVTLKNTGVASRATDGGFKDGIDAENKVEKVLFFFFDANKEVYAVSNGNNYLEAAIEMNAKDPVNDNVEEISNEILVIEESKNVPPQYVVAVLNAPAELKANSSLAELQTKIGAYNTTGEGFVMTNSVYKHSVTGEAVVATELTHKNLGTTAEEAKANPVDIYVERVAAKVEVTAGEKFDTGIKFNDKAIYAKIKGWNVTNCKENAYLFKSINTAWTDDALGFKPWNDAANFRSYWANTEETGAPKHPHNWGALSNAAGAYNYFYENTDAEGKPQLLVAAEFVDEAGKELDFVMAEWYGTQYTLDDLKKAFANAVKDQIFVKASAEATTATSITPDDIDFFQEAADAEDNRYNSFATLAAASTGKLFVDAEMKALTAEQVKGMLKTIRPAKIWKAGGYYYFNIDHLGTAEGLVRNHWYEITVNGIKGLGTPVYDPDMIITPEKPEGDASYIAARVNILSWKVVKQEVTLE